MADPTVPFDAKFVMQQVLWKECIAPAGNEWTTWSDCITLAETAAAALTEAGYSVVLASEVAAVRAAIPLLREAADALREAEALLEHANLRWDGWRTADNIAAFLASVSSEGSGDR